MSTLAPVPCYLNDAIHVVKSWLNLFLIGRLNCFCSGLVSCTLSPGSKRTNLVILHNRVHEIYTTYENKRIFVNVTSFALKLHNLQACKPYHSNKIVPSCLLYYLETNTARLNSVSQFQPTRLLYYLPKLKHTFTTNIHGVAHRKWGI